MEDIRQAVGVVLLEERVRRQMTQRVLATLMGLTLDGLAKTLRRTRKGEVKIETVARLADALDCEVIWSARIILPDGEEVTVSGIVDPE